VDPQTYGISRELLSQQLDIACCVINGSTPLGMHAELQVHVAWQADAANMAQQHPPDAMHTSLLKPCL
jgi:hypothetical protein